MATGTLNAIDYSFSPPDHAQAYAGGVKVFCRYLSPSSGKDFTAPEVHTIHTLGLGDASLHMLWEGYADDAKRGYAKGFIDGQSAIAAVKKLQAEVGYVQQNVPGVSFAVDYDAPRSQWTAIADYFRGVRAACAQAGFQMRVGAYGKYSLITWLKNSGWVDFRFLTYAWLYGYVPNRSSAALYQFQNGQNRWGGVVDYCQVNDAAALGLWYSPHHPANQPPEIDIMEEIMALPGAPKTYAEFRQNAQEDAQIGAHNAIMAWADGHKIRTFFADWFGHGPKPGSLIAQQDAAAAKAHHPVPGQHAAAN